MEGYKSLLDMLYQAATTENGITLIDSLNQKQFVSYQQLCQRSRYLCSLLQAKGAKKGQEVVIQCDNVEYFMYAFWACVNGGFIAFLVDTSQNEFETENVQKIFEMLEQPYVLYDKKACVVQDNKNIMLDMTTVAYSQSQEMEMLHTNPTSEEDLVYVQFSSGSTGIQKGISIRNKNIYANVKGIQEHLNIDSTEKFLSWSPLTHCLGLVVFHLLPIYLGANQYHMSTELYMRNPISWLDYIHQFRISRLGTIPFALKHLFTFYENSKEVTNWELSCIKSIIIGAEQVRFELCNQFVELMQKYKMNSRVMVPAYGITEATAMVSGDGPDQELLPFLVPRDQLEIGSKLDFLSDKSKDAMTFLELGKPIPGFQVKIENEQKQPMEEGCIGHILLKGDSVASGYYKNEKSTKEVMQSDGWFSTGDLGFMYQGKLVLVGREKDLIVVNGKKYTSLDLEDVIYKKVNKDGWTRVVVCNVINVQRNAEDVVIFVESDLELKDKKEKEKLQNISTKIRQILFDTVGVIPQYIIPVECIPCTYTGKLKRKELENQFYEGKFECVIEEMKKSNTQMKIHNGSEKYSREKIRTILVDIIDEMLKIHVSDYELSFQDYGIVSVNVPPFMERINQEFQTNMHVSDLYNNPNVNQLTDCIFKMQSSKNQRRNNQMNETVHEVKESDKIAIVGMSCRLPNGANTVEDFWNLLLGGKDGIVDIPEDRWDVEKYYDEDENIPGKMYCKKGGFLDGNIGDFDAKFFNISPKEATALDPQQRLMLELTWEAFENADLDITKYNGTNTGVYLGMSTSEYTLAHLYSGDLNSIDAYSLTGICMSTACGRISYTFGFEGPCIAVDTACSSTLSALHLACTAMQNGETDTAVVGGISLMESPTANIGFSKLHATAVDGHCKTFDASANGYGRGEGGGVLLLKKLEDAKKDNDMILGIIRATGINQDGKSNGLTAPNGASQEKLIRKTIEGAGVKAQDIDYIEMHGTGTKLGDPIEVGAVAATYGVGRTEANLLKAGSVKSNIGHLEAAAGIASIIKVLLSLQKNMIPANLNYNEPNPLIDWSNANIDVVSEHKPWEPGEKARIAAINGFGFGGSNAHVILEEYRKVEEESIRKEKGIDYILKLSAKSSNALKRLVEEYCSLIETSEDDSFEDIIYSADQGRADLEYRFAVHASGKEEMVQRMKDYQEGLTPEGVYENISDHTNYKKDRQLVFMFTGQGSQYVNMGRTLYESNEVFKEAMDLCDKLFKPYLLKSITQLLYGENADSEIIEKTVYAQPLIFSIEYALVKIWESYGVVPKAVMGHSIGEYAAAVTAGIISLEDAVKLVSIRGRLMDSAPGSGSMSSVFASEEEVRALIAPYKDTVSIAARNAKETCVISGDTNDVKAVMEEAKAKGYRVKELKVSHAFHSKLMEPILDDFRLIADEATYEEAKVKFISALYARALEEGEILDSEYWTVHIREKVDFYKAITSVENASSYVFLEIGSNRVLSALCKLIFDEGQIAFGTLNLKKEEQFQLADTISGLYTAGVNVDWSKIAFIGTQNWKKVQLPIYPFERSHFWRDLQYDRSGSVLSEGEYSRLLGQRIESPCLGSGSIFQSTFTAESPYFMKEHVIFNTAISPAAGHVSMVLSALKEMEQAKSCELKDIEFRAPLAVTEDEERQVQICMEEVSDDNLKFTIASRDKEEGHGRWLEHATGKAEVFDTYRREEKMVDISELEKLDYRADAEETIYSFMEQSGFELGDGFRRISKIHYGEKEGISLIEPSTKIPERDMYVLYPGTIDSIFQTGLTVILEQLKNEHPELLQNNATIIPYYIEKLIFNYRKTDRLWCHTTKSSVQGDVIYCDITIYNDDGEMVMTIEGFMGKITSSDNLLRELKNTQGHLFYHTQWIKAKKTEIAGKTKNLVKYVIVSNHGESMEALLKEAGNDTVTVSLEEIDEDKLQELVTAADGSKLRFIYYAGCNETRNVQVTKGLFTLVKAIISKGYGDSCSVKVVTNNVQNVENNDTVSVSEAPLWGFGKVLSMEYPEIFDGLLDIDEQVFSLQKEQVLAEVTSKESEEVCLRGEAGRYVSHLVRHAEYIKGENKKPKTLEIKEDGTYLITGGTGALGLVYAEYLTEKGVKHIVLTARHEASKGAAEKIKQLEEKGVEIKTVISDVSDKESLKAGLEEIKDLMPAIRGVIHAAGTLRDMLIDDITWDDFWFVMNPKVNGCWNLYEELNDVKLDFFVMLSSITSQVGNMGQSNYAAANYFMNQFAQWMQKKGIPAYAMCWGPWQSGGMATGSADVDKNMDAMGIKPFASEQGLQLIRQFFEEPYNGMVIADMDWKKMSRNTRGNWQEVFLAGLVEQKEEVQETEQQDASLLQELSEKNDEDRRAYLLHVLQEKCGAIMGFAKGDLPSADIGLREQGADSLMTFSMRSGINKMLGVNLDVSTFFNYPTLSDLTNYLLDEVLFAGDEAEAEIEDSTDDILSELEQMLDE